MSKYSERRKREESVCRDYPMYRADALEDLIWGALVGIAGDPTRIAQIQRSISEKTAPQIHDADVEVAQLSARLTSLEQQAMRLTTSFSEGRMPEYLWEGQLHRIEQDRIQVTKGLETAKSRVDELKSQPVISASITEIQAYLNQVLTDCTDTLSRREALGILVGTKGIKVSRNGTIDFDLRIPLDLADCPSLVGLSALTRPEL